MLDQHKTLCHECFSKHEKKIEATAIKELLKNNKIFKDMIYGPRKIGCLVMVMVPLGIGFVVEILVGLY